MASRLRSAMLLRPRLRRPYTPSSSWRTYITDNKPPHNNNNNNNNNKYNLAATNEYLDKLQASIQPRLTPVLLKVRSASDTLRKLKHEINDPKDALRRCGAALNQLTGYDHIEQVKSKVNDQAKAFEASRDQMQQAKRDYEHAIDQRSGTQREINELLQRKHMWSGEDVTRFTELYRLEHEHARHETEAKESYQHAEKQMDRRYMGLAQSIMERYHEEQLWSDKIRSVSTYGTWALMVVNLILFIMMQSIFEPYKRKRLTDRFEELLIAKVDEEEGKFRDLMTDRDRTQQSVLIAIKELAAALASSHAHLEDQLKPIADLPSLMAAPPSAPEAPPAAEPLAIEDVTFVDPFAAVTYSPLAPADDEVVLKKRSLILYSVESAVAGGLITALVMALWNQ